MPLTSVDHGAELMRVLRLYIATANLAMRAMKASHSKDASPEFAKQYQEAVSHLNQAADTLKGLSNKLQPAGARKK